ncbi:(R,R)-butanediol dehydrogenase / meso-butanediol dehydrogenase / diacetyl reductase [Raineyella antarctica]|uniref:(R,R)-butanediol dehydrogenase / meso-butanediol dehydrogenase / diacetyl reductase n=1 Tax=Raineyella antarctica TaxID=1577474 RepID=A0A1G6GGZ4_9ACTN|nr:2,3-butanediol dehydrogenase [Raineyella antarctica]SDB80456.1 (R,R)-butanediol dehydrogenase / meso-butanediol dehydrogenase / diacetyl reductase [Raineyella antarctica]
MRAARFYDRGDIRIDEIPEPEVKPGEVGIDVAWCGICGSDLHEYLEGPLFVPPAGHPHPISGESAPVTLGHEFSGVVSSLGEGVDDLQVGQHVVVEPYIIHDDVDTGPESRDYHLSRELGFIGLSGCGGGLGEKVSVKRRWVHPIRNDVPLDEAALIEPLSVAYHAVDRSGAKAGDFVLVGGAGPIGSLTAAVLKARGATVAVTELSELRRQRVLDTGVADHVFDPTKVDVAEEVRRLTGGRGADAAVEATSAQPVLDTLLNALRPQGVLQVVAIWTKRASIDLFQVVMKEIEVRGSIAYVNTHPSTIQLVESGAIDLKPFITGRIGLDDLIDKGFETLIHHNETAVKILVSPSGEGL